ncbi:peptide deformylase [Micromonospora saelicesensis]|uniref:peptide deformylase n=1 Tax=Micromonospora saelicesensis TaxID=285676 RepID=UPI000DD9D6A0|nr:peptide deformylase [Micromonospora saelicesensis]
MTVREILKVGRQDLIARDHEVLMKPSRAVEADLALVGDIVTDLIDTMQAHPTCVGLAAPQIGYSVTIAVVRKDVAEQERPLVLIDPIIEALTGKTDGKSEACMSLPGWCGLVKRKPKVELSFSDGAGRQASLRAEGYLSRVIQHEVDHLLGILYPFRMRSDDALVERQLADKATTGMSS